VVRSIRRMGRSRLLVLAIAALIPALAGCEAGNNAPTQNWHQPTDGSEVVHDEISLLNAFVLGAPLGSQLKVGQTASVFFAVANNGSADKLVSISAPGTAKSVSLPAGGVSLPKGQVVLLTGPMPKITLHGLTRSLSGGSTVRLVVTFQNAASVNLTVPVMPRAQYYSTFSPPSPTPTATGTKAAAPKASPSPSASASP
jgi:copper(I)-binding protein